MNKFESDMVVDSFNPSTWEADGGGSGLQNEFQENQGCDREILSQPLTTPPPTNKQNKTGYGGTPVIPALGRQGQETHLRLLWAEPLSPLHKGLEPGISSVVEQGAWV